MPRRNRPYLNETLPDQVPPTQADSVDSSVSPSQLDLTEAVSMHIPPTSEEEAVVSHTPPEPEEVFASPDVLPEPEEAAASPDVLPEPEEVAASPDISPEPEEAAASPDIPPEPEQTVVSGALAELDSPREEVSLKRRKTARGTRERSDSYDTFDPQKLSGNGEPKKEETAPAISGTINQEWLNSNRQAGFIPTASDSRSAGRRKRLKPPSALIGKIEPMLHEFREKLSGSEKSGKVPRYRRSPGVQAGAGYVPKDTPPQKRTISRSQAGIRQENQSAGYRPRETDSRGGITLFGHHIPGNTIRLILMGIFGAVALYSLIMIARIVWRSIRTSQVNQELSQRHSQPADTDSADIPFTIYTEEDSEDSADSGEAESPGETVVAAGNETDENALSADSSEGEPENSPSQEQLAAQATPTPAPLVLTTKFHQIGGDALPEMASLYKDNHDLVGWLNIPDILDLPVVYRDNVYYLTHDFYKQKNTSGTLFLDENHPYKEKSQNLLFHGHNMRDGSMFGRLTQYKSNLSFLKNNAFFTYSSLWKKEEYVIFAVLQVSLNPRDPTFFNYFTHSTFRTDIEFITYISDLMAHSMYAIPVDIKPSDALITLSTCLEDDRLVIVARKLREGESRHHLKEIVQSAARL